MRLLLIFALAAAAAPAVADKPSSKGLDGEQLLAKLLAGRTAGKPQSCLPSGASRYGSRTIQGVGILYREGGTYWLNRFGGGCPQLSDFDIPVTVSPSGQACRGDFTTIVDRTSRVSHGTCVLGDFTPYARPGGTR